MTSSSRQPTVRLAAAAVAAATLLRPDRSHALVPRRAAPRAVSCAEARALVVAALPARVRRLPKFELDPRCPGREGTLRRFSAVWAGTPGGSVVAGIYAVDVRTADVWDAVMGGCEALRTPALRATQARVRARLGLSGARYRALRRDHRGPFCDEADRGTGRGSAAGQGTPRAEAGARAG